MSSHPQGQTNAGALGGPLPFHPNSRSTGNCRQIISGEDQAIAPPFRSLAGHNGLRDVLGLLPYADPTSVEINEANQDQSKLTKARLAGL
jgi:hypothetical protein